MHRRYVSLALAALLLIVTGCGATGTGTGGSAPATTGASPATAPAVPQEITIRVVRDVLNMDPARISTTEDHSLAFNVYSGLVRLKAGSLTEVEPDLATEWTLSPDGRTYTFKLRPGVKWHKNYGDFTADDVIYSLKRVMDRATGSQYAGDFKAVESIEAPDSATVKITLKQPVPNFLTAVLAYRAGLIVNRKAIETLGKQYVDSPIGTGPFVFSERVPGERIVLTRYPDYFGPKPSLEKATFKLVKEDSLAQIALERGDVDLSYFDDPETQKLALAHKDLVTQQISGVRTYYMGLNATKPPFNNIKVRQAVQHAINRQAIVDHVLLGMAKPGNSILNPNVFGYISDNPYAYDPDKARQLLREAGFGNGFNVDLHTFNLIKAPDIAAVIQQDLKAVGINTEIKVLEFSVLQEELKSKQHAMFIGAQARLEPEQYLFPLFHSSMIPHPNAMHFRGADDLIAKAQITVDDAQRKALYGEIQRKIQADASMVPLAYPIFVMSHRKTVQGAKISPTFVYNLWDIRITK